MSVSQKEKCRSMQERLSVVARRRTRGVGRRLRGAARAARAAGAAEAAEVAEVD